MVGPRGVLRKPRSHPVVELAHGEADAAVVGAMKGNAAALHEPANGVLAHAEMGGGARNIKPAGSGCGNDSTQPLDDPSGDRLDDRVQYAEINLQRFVDPST
jgi:hypothetical protein